MGGFLAESFAENVVSPLPSPPPAFNQTPRVANPPAKFVWTDNQEM
jgi:hypothetical protein